MGRKAALSNDTVMKLHAEMKAKNVTYREVAQTNNLNPAMLYSAFRRLGLEIVAGKRGRPPKVLVAA